MVMERIRVFRKILKDLWEYKLPRTLSRTAFEESLAADDWSDNVLPDFSGGLNLFLSPDSIQDNQNLRSDNCRITGDRILADTGYTQYHTDTLLGTPLKIFRFRKQADTIATYLLTTKTVYIDTANQWRGVNTSVTDTLDTSEAAGQTVLGVTDTTGFTAPSAVKVELDTGEWWHSTIASVSAGVSVTIDDAMPSLATSGNTITQLVTLTGTVDNRISVVGIPWSDQFVFTNGLDAIYEYTESTGNITALTGLPGSDTECISLAVWDSSLFLINTNESSSPFPQRVRWSDKGDITEWATGDSGSVDLFDSTDQNVVAKKLGPYLMIYRQRGIHRVALSSKATSRFSSDKMIETDGVDSINSVVEISENQHIVFGRFNFYLYSGDFALTPIGNPVKKAIFGASGEFDVAEAPSKALFYDKEKEDIIAVFQAVSGTEPVVAYIYNIINQAWTGPRTYTDPIYDIGNAETDTALAWDTVDSALTWAAVDPATAWNSAVIEADSVFNLIVSDTDTFQYDGTGTDDNGTAITKLFETKEFAFPMDMRLDWIDYKCTGGSGSDAQRVTISVSTDGGVSYTVLGRAEASTVLTTFRVFKQIVFNRLRIRIDSDSSNFCVLDLNVRLRPESEMITLGSLA